MPAHQTSQTTISPTPPQPSCLALPWKCTTDEVGTIHHHPTATELTLVCYQYLYDSDT